MRELRESIVRNTIINYNAEAFDRSLAASFFRFYFFFFILVFVFFVRRRRPPSPLLFRFHFVSKWHFGWNDTHGIVSRRTIDVKWFFVFRLLDSHWCVVQKKNSVDASHFAQFPRRLLCAAVNLPVDCIRLMKTRTNCDFHAAASTTISAPAPWRPCVVCTHDGYCNWQRKIFRSLLMLAICSWLNEPLNCLVGCWCLTIVPHVHSRPATLHFITIIIIIVVVVAVARSK